MKKYVFTGEKRSALESLRQPFAIYQFIDKRVVTLLLSDGFCDLFGYKDDRASAIYDMAVNMGLAFQLQDDYLDVWGDPATFGKEIGGDILNNTKTFLLINAMNLARGNDAIELHQWLNDNTSRKKEKIQAVTAIYEKLGLKQLSRDTIAHYSQMALDSLHTINNIDQEAMTEFETLINRLTNRDR